MKIKFTRLMMSSIRPYGSEKSGITHPEENAYIEGV